MCSYLLRSKVRSYEATMEFFCDSNDALQGKMSGKVVVAERHWVFFAEQGSRPSIDFLAQSLSNADSIQLQRRLLGKNYLTSVVKVPRTNERGSDVLVWRLYPKGLRCETFLRELQRKEDDLPYESKKDDDSLGTFLSECASALWERIVGKVKQLLPIGAVALVSSLPVIISIFVICLL